MNGFKQAIEERKLKKHFDLTFTHVRETINALEANNDVLNTKCYSLESRIELR